MVVLVSNQSRWKAPKYYSYSPVHDTLETGLPMTLLTVNTYYVADSYDPYRDPFSQSSDL